VLGISLLAERILVFQEDLCSMKLVNGPCVFIYFGKRRNVLLDGNEDLELIECCANIGNNVYTCRLMERDVRNNIYKRDDSV
jgi:hypothetical protein